MSNLNQPTSKAPVKKVAAAGIGGSLVVILVAILSGISPDVFNSLGSWAPLVSAAVVALTAFLSGYIKKS
jgi:hypothetical protein